MSCVGIFEHLGYMVEFVKNFTDVDDKIIKRANDEGVTCSEITTKYIAAYHEDMQRLGIRPAWREPKATESYERYHSIDRRPCEERG